MGNIEYLCCINYLFLVFFFIKLLHYQLLKWRQISEKGEKKAIHSKPGLGEELENRDCQISVVKVTWGVAQEGVTNKRLIVKYTGFMRRTVLKAISLIKTWPCTGSLQHNVKS